MSGRRSDPDDVCSNLCHAIPEPSVRPLSANQIFNAMSRPRHRTMRGTEAALEDLVSNNLVEVVVMPGAGKFRLYKWRR